MRIASRVIGVVLALAGIAFFTLGVLLLMGPFDRKSVLETPAPIEWAASGFFAAIGIGLILGGWYYLRMDTEGGDSSRPPSRVDKYVFAHRREFGVLAQAGVAISVIRLVTISIGSEWPESGQGTFLRGSQQSRC